MNEIINSFNVYKDGTKLIGVSEEISIPDLTGVTDTISGAGILGSISMPAIGHFDDIEAEIPFRMLDDDIFTLASPLNEVNLVLRAGVQTHDIASGGIDSQGMRIVYRGRVKTFKSGKVKGAEQMGASVTLSITYMLIEIGGATKLELDKLNSKYVVNGVDVMEKFRGYC
jgi:Phage tail tube protein FII